MMDLTSEQRMTILAAFLGWMLDAFDFFLLTFLLKDIAKEFGVDVPAVAYALFLTLAMRFVGAFIFGRLGRPVGTQAGADAGYPLLFDPRRARRFLAEPHDLPDPARACSASPWAANGASAARSRWNPFRPARGGWCPAFCNAATRPASCLPPSPMACSMAERSATIRSAGGRCSCSASCPPFSCCSSAAAFRNPRPSRRRRRMRSPRYGRRSKPTGAWSSTWSS